MKVTYTSIHPVATWKWDTSSEPHYLWRVATDAPAASSSKLPKELFKFGEVDDDDDEDDDVCGICRLAYEACCPTCKVPGDDCPLSELLEQLWNPLADKQSGVNASTSSTCIVC